ncbi:MAG: hypothetical protein JNJ54_04565 [Myxococcaceae bacterium]|nr:hypothetical protein [Myxococcaceae bacterium]
MRDARFAQPGADTRAAASKAAVERVLEAAIDHGDLDALLREWWVEVLARDSEGEAADTEKVERLRQKCATLSGGQGTLATHASGVLLRDVSGAEYGAGAYLLGESAAAALRTGADGVVGLDRAVQFLSECWEAVEVLIEALDREPRWPANPDLLSSLPATIDKLVSVRWGRRMPSEILLEEEAKARARGLMAYLWERHHEHVDLVLSAWVRVALLARRDWGPVTEVAERLPLRELREDLWRHLHLHEDREAILALIRAAPPVFQGGGWTGRTVGLAALEKAVTHADQLQWKLAQQGWASEAAKNAAAAQLVALVDHELPEWFRQVVEAAHSRPDGRALLLFFGASIVREALRPRMSHRQWSSADLAIAAIQKVIVPAPTTEEMMSVARLGVPIGSTKVDRVVYVVSAAVFGCEARSLWAWYRTLLTASDEDLCWQARTWRRSACYDAIAHRLGELPKPFEEWRAAWRSLFVTDRERARFDSTSQSALLPSAHLIRVGMALLRLAPAREAAREFYGELRAKVRGLVKNDLRLGSPLPREFPTEGLDLAPTLLGEGWPSAFGVERSALASAEVRVYAASALLDGGAQVAAIEAALETAPHRLADTVHAVKAERDRDDNLRRHCDKVSTALHEHGGGTAADGSGAPPPLATALPPA